MVSTYATVSSFFQWRWGPTPSASLLLMPRDKPLGMAAGAIDNDPTAAGP